MASVMVVDDDADGCEALSVYLTARGHAVRCVPDGREALAGVIAQPPDVIVLDLLMPQMDGASFLEVMRSYARLRALPVVVLTGIPDSPLADRVEHLGVHALLTKARATFEEIAGVIEDAASAGSVSHA